MPNIKVYYGVYDGQVCSINDPENRGRIKCIIPEVTGESPSAWCEPCIPVAYDDGGDFFLPSLKEFVWVMFEQGNPNKPVYFGGWWSQNRTPLGNDYDEKKDSERIISYKKSIIKMLEDRLEIRFNNNEGDVPELTILDGTVLVNGQPISGGGVTSYTDLTDKPKIEGVTLEGDKTYEELNLQRITNTEMEDMLVIE